MGEPTTIKYRTPHLLPTPHQAEIAVILIEECAELTKALTKLLRFGARDGYPDSRTTNAADASLEAGQLIEMIDQAVRAGIIDKHLIDTGRLGKREKLKVYLQTEPPNV